MVVVDREAFLKKIPVLAVRVAAPLVDALRKKLGRDNLISIPRIKGVAIDGRDPSKRLIYLAQNISRTSQDGGAVTESIGPEAEIIPSTIALDYGHCTADEVLARLLPEGMDIPSSFETVGHIAHVNLRDEHQPYKEIIGQVLLDKNPGIRTVVNKIGSIDTAFRFFNMEVLAGEDCTLVEVREEGCVFEFDYAKVYWNSRLQFEHRRLVQTFDRSHYVCDMFCGVGPFALPAAKRGCTVYANDLNPESVYWLRKNAARNRVASRLHIYNMDAREFVGQALRDLAQRGGARTAFDHYIMNLPASAHSFLDLFVDLVREGLIGVQDAETATLIHCYTFCRGDEDPRAKVEAALGCPLGADRVVLIRRVRDVAPNKEMFCVSFRLPLALFSSPPPTPAAITAKRAKLEDSFKE